MDKYNIIRRIGKGSFGRIFLIECDEGDCEFDGVPTEEGKQLFVLKEVELPKKDGKIRDRAINEAKFMQRLDHPNIVSVYEYFMNEEKGTLSIIMEYVDGGDLHDLIEDHKSMDPIMYLSEETVIDYMAQILGALRYIHGKKILHRDIKAQNIFLSSTGDLKLGDFGVCTALEKTGAEASTQIGTPYSLSPEICQGQPYNQE